MRASEISKVMQALLPNTQRPLYLWGPPGVGKSAVIHQTAKQLDLALVDIRAVLLDPVDLRGLPSIAKGHAVWCPPAFLPREKEHGKRGIIFLDELAQAPPLVQAGCLQLTLDRKLGEYTLPDGWIVVAASNRQEDRAGAHKLITPLLNRFIHLDLEVNNDDWQEWAVERIHTEVRSFLRFRPGLLHMFDATSGERAFPTPRSWAFVSEVLPHTPREHLHQVVAGCVGKGAAAEFEGYLQVYKKLPDIDAILASPKSAKVPGEPSILFALTGALVDRCKDPTATKLHEAFGEYVTRMPNEFAVLAIKDLMHFVKKFGNEKSIRNWLLKNRGLFGDFK